MDWSPKQEQALAEVQAWIQNPGRDQIFRLFGYAGTGKTTLAKHFASHCTGEVVFAAYTGKAASVMRSNGCPNATTIHRLIYKPAPKSEVRLLELREYLLSMEKEPETPELIKRIADAKEEMLQIERDLKQPAFVINHEAPVKDASLIVVDECSMVGGEMADDLMSFGVPILVLGDPAQLPPVRGEGFFTNATPNVMLTEIHRQAQDSPIIHLATQVRNLRTISPGTYGSSLVVRQRDLDRESVMHHDQILVGRNRTRKACNERARALLGRQSHLPEVNDRLVCLRNNHVIGLLNGELWNTRSSTVIDPDTLALEIGDDELKRTLCVEAHRHPFEGREVSYWEKQMAQEFDYGYALTTHKAQGSQWGSVIVFDESGCFRQERHRWLYTAITRAAERITIVKGA